MSRIFITGSSDGLGLMAARLRMSRQPELNRGKIAEATCENLASSDVRDARAGAGENDVAGAEPASAFAQCRRQP
jgi:hypothetical protein